MSSPVATVVQAAPRAARPHLRWWREVLTVVVFYGAYTLIRDAYTSPGGKEAAERNARWIIHAERDLHIFDEQHIQHAILGMRYFVEFWNSWYGTAHFVAVTFVLVYLYRKRPRRYPLWRNTFALMNLVALVGFTFFPLVPPRLLPATYHFVDTLAHYGGPWNFSSGAVAKASDQYAAMPSMHTGWSTWCAIAMVPEIRPRWGKIAVFAYPAVTVFCIIVTGNHYFLDAAGGLVSLGISYLVARPITAWWASRTWLRPEPLLLPDP